MLDRPLVLIHGYSADSKAFHPLRDMLKNSFGINLNLLNICNYVSLNNEITIKDIAEGLDRAFRFDPTLNSRCNMRDCQFDAIVHSTGMLVLRTWLANYANADRSSNVRLGRLKHLIGLAPATWGSPQAHKGRTWLGTLVKGNRQLGPDFLNAGDAILDGLELGSKFTWDLAHIDLLGKSPFYGKENDTPYVAVFIGNTPYDGLSSVANDPGTDGTVRWSGCGLNTRKITIDLTRFPKDEDANPTRQRLRISKWADDRLNVPIIPVPNRNHATILSDPDPEMVQHIVDLLSVSDAAGYDAWLASAASYGDKAKPKMLVNPGAGVTAMTQEFSTFFDHLTGRENGPNLDGWQQFVVRAVDERGDGVTDYLIEVLRTVDGKDEPFTQMYTDVHAYRADPSFRCVHVQLPQGISTTNSNLKLRIHASSGTALIGYQGYKDSPAANPSLPANSGEGQAMNALTEPIVLDLNDLQGGSSTLFHPFTTTLVELIISREPVPLQNVSQVLTFDWSA